MDRDSWLDRLWYFGLQFVMRLLSIALLRVRCRGLEHLPEGGCMVLPNHQSFLDPILIGITYPRRLNFLARQSLLRFAPFRWFLQSLHTIPLDREGPGLAGMRETLRRLKNGESMLIFPEGTRTSDGEIAPLKPGFTTLARRAKVPLVPVAIAGAYEAWPRQRRLPTLGTVEVRFAPALMPDEVATYSDDELVAEFERRLRACYDEARHDRLARLARGPVNVEAGSSSRL
jgi:1-acyl-sn-glycerol-3-phosphate acyltransferase